MDPLNEQQRRQNKEALEYLVDISANISASLDWKLWSDDQKKVFALCLYPEATCKKEPSAEDCWQACLINRRFFNSFDHRVPPPFIESLRHRISDPEIRRLAPIVNLLRPTIAQQIPRRAPFLRAVS